MIKFKEAEHYKQLANKKVRCMLCPHNCIIDNGELGKCNVRMNIDGKLKAMAYSKPHSIKYSKIIDIPLYHYFPESEPLIINTLGGNLPSINNPLMGKTINEVPLLNQNPSHIKKQMDKTKTKLIVFQKDEPFISYEYIKAVSKHIDKKIVIVTNGFIEEAPLMDIIPSIGAALVEIKSMSEDFYQSIEGKLSTILRTIKLLHDHGVWVEIKLDLIPETYNGLYEVRNLVSWILNNLDGNVPLHLGIISTVNNNLADDMLLKARKISMESGMNYVYLHGLNNLVNTTICPNCKRELMENNQGLKILNLNLGNGKCLCGKEIAGVWHSLQ